MGGEQIGIKSQSREWKRKSEMKKKYRLELEEMMVFWFQKL